MASSWQGKIAALALSDSEFKERLVLNPHDAIAEITGAQLSKDFKVVVHENDANTFHLVLPRKDFPDSVDPQKFLEKLRQETAIDRPGPCTSSVNGGTCW